MYVHMITYVCIYIYIISKMPSRGEVTSYNSPMCVYIYTYVYTYIYIHIYSWIEGISHL